MSVEHKVDEIIIDGRIDQSYNYIDYVFDDPKGRVRARAYFDGTRKVAIYPPMRPGEPPELTSVGDNHQALLGYLARRFLVIQVLGLNGYETIWMARHAKRVADAFGLDLDD